MLCAVLSNAAAPTHCTVIMSTCGCEFLVAFQTFTFWDHFIVIPGRVQTGGFVSGYERSFSLGNLDWTTWTESFCRSISRLFPTCELVVSLI